MLKIQVNMNGLDGVKQAVANIQKQARYAAAVALTRTAKAIKDAMPTIMDQELDRPTPFTKRGLFVKAARPSDLTAVVGFMDRQASYLKYQISGGTRAPTARGIKLQPIPVPLYIRKQMAQQQASATGPSRHLSARVIRAVNYLMCVDFEYRQRG